MIDVGSIQIDFEISKIIIFSILKTALDTLWHYLIDAESIWVIFQIFKNWYFRPYMQTLSCKFLEA